MHERVTEAAGLYEPLMAAGRREGDGPPGGHGGRCRWRLNAAILHETGRGAAWLAR
jgi:hypothetical protein